MSDVLVVVGPGVVADSGLLAEIAGREFAELGVRGGLVRARDAAHLRGLVREAGPAVVVPGPSREARALIGQSPGGAVWVDIERVPGAGHIHGRGVAGVAWGIRHAVHRARHPAACRIAYGPSPEQWGELYLPEGAGKTPVVALVHGGYWRSNWAADLMEGICADLVGRGFAVWNLEYRRPDLHGWPATTTDLASGLSALHRAGTASGQAAPHRADTASGLSAPHGADLASGQAAPHRADLAPGSGAARPSLDLDRVAVVGHSAGAQLALRAVADGARVALAVSLAGVLDLVEGDRRWLSSGAVAAALGAHPSAGPGVNGVYLAASPLLRLPLDVPQLIVQGAADDLDLVDFSRRYADAAQQAGDDVTYLEMPGDHFDVITPTTPIWQATAQAITDALTWTGPAPRTDR